LPSSDKFSRNSRRAWSGDGCGGGITTAETYSSGGCGDLDDGGNAALSEGIVGLRPAR